MEHNVWAELLTHVMLNPYLSNFFIKLSKRAWWRN